MKRVFLLLFAFVTLTACGMSSSEYEERVNNVVDEMIDISLEAELIIDQYTRVWERSIKNKGAFLVAEMSTITGIDESDVEKYFDVTSIGTIVDDFSSNVNAVKSYHESEGTLDELKNKMKEIKESVTELNKHKSEHEEVFDLVLDLYDLTDEFVGLSINPTGSLQEFREQKSTLANKISSNYKRIGVLVPNKE